MYRKFLLTAASISIGMVVSASAAINIPTEKLDRAAIPEPRTDEHRPVQKEWTVIVYMNAKNDLENTLMADLNEMETVGSGKDINIVAEAGVTLPKQKAPVPDRGFSPEPPHIAPEWRGARRLLMTKDSNPEKLSSQILEDIGDVDMGDYKTLENFITWAKEKFPARRYLTIIWGHGAGWENFEYLQFSHKPIHPKAVSPDDVTGNYITDGELGLVFQDTGKTDVLLFDACLMQMIEVAHEIGNGADVIIASQETIPWGGMAYDKFLAAMAAKPSLSEEELARAVITTYYDIGDDSHTMSAIRTSKLPALAAMLAEWANLAKQEPAKNLSGARQWTQTFRDSQRSYRDIASFTEFAAKNSPNQQFKDKTAELARFLREEVVIFNANTHWDYKGANGLSIYVPKETYNEDYDELNFAAQTRWNDFARYMVTIK